MNLRPDPTFHATAELAMKAPAEKLAFTLMLSPDGTKPDGLAVIDVDPKSKTYSKILIFIRVSRSIGDLEAKSKIFGGNSKVVISEPEIISFKINQNSEFIVLGSNKIIHFFTFSYILQIYIFMHILNIHKI